MSLTFSTLGHVLLHIYEYDFGAAIYLPSVERYEAGTRCAIAIPVPHSDAEESSLHESALKQGFNNWLNVAVVSDTCDAASEKSEAGLIAAFNQDCQEGGGLRQMMNYRNSASSE